MRARCQTRPARSPPILFNWQTLQFESRIDRHDAVDLAVWVLVVLAGVDFLRVEEDGRDGHIEGCWTGRGDLCEVSGLMGRLRLMICAGGEVREKLVVNDRIHVLCHVDTSSRLTRPKQPSLLRSPFSPASRSLRRMGFQVRSRGSGGVRGLCLEFCLLTRRDDEQVVQGRHAVTEATDLSKELTYIFWTSCMNSPTLSTNLAAAGKAARSTSFGEPPGASLFMADKSVAMLDGGLGGIGVRWST